MATGDFFDVFQTGHIRMACHPLLIWNEYVESEESRSTTASLPTHNVPVCSHDDWRVNYDAFSKPAGQRHSELSPMVALAASFG